MNSAFNYIGIAKKAGSLAVGETEAGAACRAGKAKILLLASDASDNTVRRAENLISGHKTLIVRLNCTKAELGELSGSRACALAAVTDVGIAASLLGELSKDDGDYAQAAADMAAKNEKAKKRKAEALAHERNKRVGKTGGAVQKVTRRKSK